MATQKGFTLVELLFATAIMVIVLLVTVFLDLLVAVAIGMVMAAFLFMKKMSDITEEKTKITDIGELQQEQGWSDEDMPDNVRKNVLVKHLDGPLFFGFASGFTEKVATLRDIKFVIIRMKKVPFIDQTGLYALEDAILSLEQKGINVLLTSLQDQPRIQMEKINIIPGLISKENVFEKFSDCVEWLRDKCE